MELHQINVIIEDETIVFLLKSSYPEHEIHLFNDVTKSIEEWDFIATNLNFTWEFHYSLAFKKRKV